MMEAFTGSLNGNDTPRSVIHSALSPEMMGEIFLQTLVPHPPDYSCPSPLFLGKICRSWRNIAWSTPNLWDVVDLYLSEGRYKTQIDILSEWLSRAKSRPLSIRITGCQHKLWMPLELLQSVITTHSKNLESLDLCIPKRHHEALEKTKHTFPLLKVLSIRTAYGIPPKASLNLFENSPSLTNLTAPGYFLAHLAFPWHQITRFTGDILYTHECVRLLYDCPQLAYLRLSHVSYIGNIHPILTPFTHTHLASLQIITRNCRRNGDIERLVDLLTLPSLHELKIFWSDEFTFSTITKLLSRSSCALLSLAIGNFIQTQTELIKHLEGLPSLVKLQIVDPQLRLNLTVEFLYRLQLPFRGGFLPKLQVLEYDGRFSFTLYALNNMLNVRWKQGNPTRLLSLKLTARTEGDVFIMDRKAQTALEDMVREGLGLSVLNHEERTLIPSHSGVGYRASPSTWYRTHNKKFPFATTF